MKSRSKRIAELTAEKRLLLQVLRKERVAHASKAEPESANGRYATTNRGKAGESQLLGARSDLPDETVRTAPFSLISDADRLRLPDDVVDAYPLTVMQLGMLTHMEMRKDSPTPPAYHNVNSFHLRGEFNAEALQEAVNRVVARHAVLRTSFDLSNYSEPLQLVHGEAELKVEVKDLRELSSREQEEELRVFLERENYRLFDLERAPLLRYYVHRLTDETFQFTLVEPHAISDGWSTNLTLAQIGGKYQELLRNEEEKEEEALGVTFRDFVWLERETLKSEAARSYWEEKLKDWTLTKLPRWPRILQTPATIEDHKVSYMIPIEVVEGLYRLARAARVPIKSVLFAAHLKVMSLVSNQSHIVTGLVFNTRPEVLNGDKVHGMYLNTLPFPYKQRPGSWIDMAQEAYEQEVEMTPYRRYPLAALQKNWGQQYLYESAFTFLNFHSVEGVLRSGTIEDLGYGGSDLSVTNFLLMANFTLSTLSPNRIGIQLGFDIDEFSKEQMRLLLSYYDRVMAVMAADPHSRHDLECLLSPREKRRLLVEWNSTKSDYPNERSFYQLFEAQVEETPEAIAVECDGKQRTYRELNARANRMSRELVEKGVGPEVVVGLLAERNIDFLIAMIAIFKAGGAYLPLDPLHPPQRISLVLGQSGVGHVVVARELLPIINKALENIVEPERQEVLCLEEMLEQQHSETNLPGSYYPDQLAYVIFTSGSTGTPKGVMVRHKGMLNHLYVKIRDLKLTEKDIVAQVASQCFDISVWQFLAALLVGGRVHIFNEVVAHDPSQLLDRVGRENVSVFETVPSMLRMILDEALRRSPAQPALSTLRWLIPTGEALPPQLCRQWLNIFPHVKLLNAYGPTECSDDVTHHPIDQAPAADVINMPIGRAVANTQLYVLDQQLQPVPTGVAGELYIGGEGVGRGYLKAPELTAERFIPDPFGEAAGGRLYKTGDVARRLSDGVLEFLGRGDQQVKLRGYRIELGEIEAALMRHPGVEQCVVLIVGEGVTDRRLIAYVMGTHQAVVSPRELRRFLKQQLPNYMLPSEYVLVEDMPLTANGKVDRQAMGRVKVAGGLPGAVSLPRRAVEELVVNLWRELLGKEVVSIEDDFFELGGHSLLAFRLATRLRQVFGVEIGLRAIFEKATVAGVSREVEVALKEQAGLGAEEIVRVSREGGLPLSYAQERLWFLEQLEPGSSQYHIPAVVRVEGQLDQEALAEAVKGVVRRHEVLRTVFGSAEGKGLQVIRGEQQIEIEREEIGWMADDVREQEARRLARAEVNKRFDLEEGPLLRMKLIEMGAEEYVLVLTLHHLIADASSMRVLVREIVALYDGIRKTGQGGDLAELAIQYGDYAVWERKRMTGEVLERELTYWQGQLGGAEATEVPTDMERARGGGREAGSYRIEIGKLRLERLRALGSKQQATMFMVLLTAWKVVLHEVSGRKDVVVGTNVANREMEETEGLIGLFVNQLVLRTRVEAEARFGDVVKRVREVCLEAYTHQGLPFEKLVEEMRVKREPNRNPLYSVKVDYALAEKEAKGVEGLRIAEMEVGAEATHGDMTLYLMESEEGIDVNLQYNRLLYLEATIETLLRKYRAVLRYVTEDDEIKVAEIVNRLREMDRQERENDKRERKEENINQLRGIRRKATTGMQFKKDA